MKPLFFVLSVACFALPIAQARTAQEVCTEILAANDAEIARHSANADKWKSELESRRKKYRDQVLAATPEIHRTHIEAVQEIGAKVSAATLGIPAEYEKKIAKLNMPRGAREQETSRLRAEMKKEYANALIRDLSEYKAYGSSHRIFIGKAPKPLEKEIAWETPVVVLEVPDNSQGHLKIRILEGLYSDSSRVLGYGQFKTEYYPATKAYGTIAPRTAAEMMRLTKDFSIEHPSWDFFRFENDGYTHYWMARNFLSWAQNDRAARECDKYRPKSDPRKAAFEFQETVRILPAT